MKNLKQINGIKRGFLMAILLVASISLPGLVVAQANKPDNNRKQVIEIRTGNKIAVLITIFKVEPENEERLIELFEEGTATLFSMQPGYISSSIHRVKEGNRLVLYGQWENQQAIDAFREKPEIGQYFQKVKALATFESVVSNDVPYVHHK